MIDSKTVVGIIPARGDGKGVSRKNMRDLAGKPLVAYTIEAARKSTLMDRVIVSTDSSELAALRNKNIRLSFGDKLLEALSTHPNMLKRIKRLSDYKA